MINPSVTKGGSQGSLPAASPWNLRGFHKRCLRFVCGSASPAIGEIRWEIVGLRKTNARVESIGLAS